MRPALVAAGLFGLVAAVVLWFFSTHERVPVKERVGPAREARENPYLAAERFAARMGVRARQLRALPEIDRLPENTALLLPGGRQALDARRVRHLVAWVESGGHLIAEAEPIGVADPLFAALGVERQAVRRAGKPPAVTLPDGRTLRVSLGGRMLLKPQAADLVLRAGAPDALQVASFERGRGMATVAADLRFARNTLIGAQQNAAFFWSLLQLTDATDVRFYLRPERLSLWAFLKEQAAPVLFALAALVGLWVWRAGPRFGPVRPDAPPARRRLLDHLRATGRYYWTHDLRARLVAAARDAALRRVARAQPDFGQAAEGARTARLARLAGVGADEAKRFLGTADSVGSQDFIRLVRTAQRVHSALERGNR